MDLYKINDIVYIAYGKYKKCIVKITGVDNNNNKFIGSVLFKNVRMMPNELVGSVRTNNNKNNSKSNINNINNSYNVQINDLVFIINGKYQGYLLKIISQTDDELYYNTSHIYNNNNIYNNIKVIPNNLFSTFTGK
jgi:hypothetical protein